MRLLKHLFDNNRAWSERIRSQNPEFFSKLARQQSPEYLWIGCSDSRVTANDVLGLDPGEVFVHRNIANVAHTSDMNLLAVLEYAVDVLRVEHVIDDPVELAIDAAKIIEAFEVAQPHRVLPCQRVLG